MVSKGQFVDHGGSWVQIPSGTRIFSELSINSISCCCCFIFNILTLEVGWVHLDML